MTNDRLNWLITILFEYDVRQDALMKQCIIWPEPRVFGTEAHISEFSCMLLHVLLLQHLFT